MNILGLISQLIGIKTLRLTLTMNSISLNGTRQCSSTSHFFKNIFKHLSLSLSLSRQSATHMAALVGGHHRGGCDFYIFGWSFFAVGGRSTLSVAISSWGGYRWVAMGYCGWVWWVVGLCLFCRGWFSLSLSLSLSLSHALMCLFVAWENEKEV